MEESLRVDGGDVLHRKGPKVLLAGAEHRLSRGSIALNEHPYKKDKNIYRASKFFGSWSHHNFVVPRMRKKLKAKKTLKLDPDGENLAQVLLSVRNELPRRVFNSIENTLKQGIKEVEELKTPLTEEGETYVAIMEKGFSKPFDHHQVSDGMLKLLAYIVAVNLPNTNLVCFEEPENFVHPRLLELILEILRESGKQVVLSTHSPYILDHVKPEEIIVFEKKNGRTDARRIEDVERIKKHLEEIGMGEMWYAGEIGGITK